MFAEKNQNLNLLKMESKILKTFLKSISRYITLDFNRFQAFK